MTTETPATTLRLRRLDLRDVAAGDPAAMREHRALIRRGAVPDPAVRDGARATLADVRARGDLAVRDANPAVGGGRPDGRLVLDADDLRAAVDRLEPPVRRALDQAIDHVRRFAETQRPTSTRTTIAPGIEIERRWTPAGERRRLRPGGSAPYPSSLVMTVVPARVAGVDRVVVASPADATGTTHPVLLAAAGLLEVDAFIVAGGAQAIGALAFGLPDAGIEPVDRIVGPGNAWVTAAKIEVCGEVGIDLPAGPSEGMVLAAPPADPRRVAADLITQAEHGPDSPAILVTTDAAFADAVEAAVTAPARARRPTRHPRRRTPRPRPDRPRAGPGRGDRLRQRLRPGAPVGRRRAARADGRPAPQRRLAVRRAVGARIRPATTRRAPTTSCRPAASPARPARCRSRRTASSARSSASTATASPSIRETIGTLAERRGPARPPRRRRDPFRGGARHMSPTPVTFSSPTAPASYSWEATDEQVAARYGVDPATIVRFDLNTSPTPPALVERPAGGRPVRGAALRIPADRLPPPDRGGRRALRRRPERAHRRCRRGRDPRHRGQGLHHGRRHAPSSRYRPTRCTAS